MTVVVTIFLTLMALGAALVVLSLAVDPDDLPDWLVQDDPEDHVSDLFLPGERKPWAPENN